LNRIEPDFLGWEVKQFAVEGFERIESAKPITMMTPEPDGGTEFATAPRPSPRWAQRGGNLWRALGSFVAIASESICVYLWLKLNG
jgi:hypothetical protein